MIVELCEGAFDGYRLELDKPGRVISSRSFLQPGQGPILEYEFVGMIGPLARYRVVEPIEEISQAEERPDRSSWFQDQRERLAAGRVPHGRGS